MQSNQDIISEAKLFQEREKQRMLYEAYCNKIRIGLGELDANSRERAIWELMQNARDMGEDNARISIKLTDDSFTFSHHGNPFDYISFYALVKQDSSKDRNDVSLAGQYGTGFMTTHILNHVVHIDAPFVIKSSSGTIGYVQIKDFVLDRSKVDTPQGPEVMRKQLDEVDEFCNREYSAKCVDDKTSFCYEMDEEKSKGFSYRLSNAIRFMPLVLAINKGITSIEIDDAISHKHFKFEKINSDIDSDEFDSDGWRKECTTIRRQTFDDSEDGDSVITIHTLVSSKGDVIVIPPFDEFMGEVKNIPSLFLWFPLLGTENFGVNFLFHSKRFHPVEKRDNIMLPGSSDMKMEKGSLNREILLEMMDKLFDYYKNDKNAADLSIDFAKVSFPEICEDKLTQAFYEELQGIWKKHIKDWKVIPVGSTRYALSEKGVRVLHPALYQNLSMDDRERYEKVLYKFASRVKDDIDALIPDTYLIQWSETVSQWQCEDDGDTFITLQDICQSIKENTEDLLDFLTLLKTTGNISLLDDFPLVPNRKGNLKKRGELRDADFMTDDVYDLVSGVMGEEAEKIVDTRFRQVCSFNDITKENLQKAISANMVQLRNRYLKNTVQNVFPQEIYDSLFKFCFASSEESNKETQRIKMMHLIADYKDREHCETKTIRFREEREEEFYEPAYNLMLDLTLAEISKKGSTWVTDNMEWLKQFIDEYRPKTNAEHYKKLNDYSVLPNANNQLCLLKDLRKNEDVPQELIQIYHDIFGKELNAQFINANFADTVDLDSIKAKDIALSIEQCLMEEMSKESERRFEKTLRDLILKLGEDEQWKKWFRGIEDKKAEYTFKMKNGKAQKHLFDLMDLNESDLERLSDLSKEDNFGLILDKMESIRQSEKDKEARFRHLYEIGKHVESVLKDEIMNYGVSVGIPNKDNSFDAEDEQNGQDIIVYVSDGDDKIPIFFIEVKSKWDFNEPAHMSTRQIQKAVKNPDNYALCCVYLGEQNRKDENLAKLDASTIIRNTRVKMDIGNQLNPLMKEIISADDKSDDVQIKIADYRSSMSKHIFLEGEDISSLICKIKSTIHSYQHIN